MSLSQMQEATAELIRLPELNRGPDLAKFMDRFDLEGFEKKEIEALARDGKVIKYGRTMAEVRWETIKKQLPFSKRYFHENTARYVWKVLFEPTAAKVRFKGLGSAYLDFIMNNEDAQKAFIHDGPPFILDLLKFEAAQARVRLENIRRDKKPAKGSRLNHMAFSIDRYKYKLSNFILDLTNPGKRVHNEEPSPEPGEEVLLVLPKEDSSDCRFFEVNEEVKTFLEEEATQPTTKVPNFFGDLASLDLLAPMAKQK